MTYDLAVSWKGTLQQHAGRLHREHAAKSDVRIIDFVGTGHPALLRMWEKRQRGYRAMGYRITQQAELTLHLSSMRRQPPFFFEWLGQIRTSTDCIQSPGKGFSPIPPGCASWFGGSGVSDLKPPIDTLEPVAEAIQAKGLLSEKDMQARDIAFQSTQSGLDLAEVFATLALRVEHLLHHLYIQVQPASGMFVSGFQT